MNFVRQAEAAGLIHRKTNLSNFEAGPLPSMTSPDESSVKANSSAPAKPDGKTIEGGLYRALHRYQGSDERWQKLRESGATDAELKAAIGDVFGLGGGVGGPDMTHVSYKGGKDPAFWFGTRGAPAKPTLKGRALIEKAREVLGIPQPVRVIRDLDAAPRDRHGRNWSSLSDIELSEWAKELRGMKGETANEWLNRVEIEMELRDSIGKLAADSRFELPKELQASRRTYEDALSMAESVKAEQQRRSTAAENQIIETSDAVEADLFDLVPDDKHKRNWSSLSDAELEQWKQKLTNKSGLAALLAPGREAEADQYLERVESVIRKRDDAWAGADAREEVKVDSKADPRAERGERKKARTLTPQVGGKL